LAKPGLSGLNSNSSEQMTQVLIGKVIHNHDNADDFLLPISLRRSFRNECRTGAIELKK
jgi:hypothetical protein